MRPDQEPRRAHPLEISRLDLISCALGAAVFLGLIFSVVRQTPPVQTSAPPFIESRWDVRGDPAALLNIRVTPPGGAPFDLPLEDFDLRLGRPKQGEAPLLQRLGEFRLLGVSRHGELSLLPTDSGPPGYRTFKLLIYLPAPGAWRLDARYQNRSDLETLEEIPRGLIVVERTIVTRDRPARRATHDLSFGEITRFTDEILIAPYPGARLP